MVNIKSEVKGGICDAYVQVDGSVRQIVEELGTAVQQMHDAMRRTLYRATRARPPVI